MCLCSLELQLCMNLIQIYLISKQNRIHLLLNAGAICVQYSLADVTGNVETGGALRLHRGCKVYEKLCEALSPVVKKGSCSSLMPSLM